MTPTTPPCDLPDEIVTTRLFDAPRELVYQAFANPSHLAEWWGPEGFRNTVEAFDFRVGGAWRIVMHAPDGKDYDNESEFVEIAAPERIVFEHLRPMHWYRMAMTLDDLSPHTRLTWRMQLGLKDEHEKLGRFIAVANEQNFDRLAAVLAKLRT